MKNLMNKVYEFMTLGLGVTAIVGYVSSLLFVAPLTPVMWLLWIIAGIVELGLVWYFGSKIDTMSFKKSLGVFLTYSALSGFTIAPLFAVYSIGSVCIAFLITAGMFGAISLFGKVTNIDLSGIGKFLFFALTGLIIATIVNIFIASSLLYWVTTYVGILIFSGLTAYDTQKIQNRVIRQGDYDEDSNYKAALSGALELYLDFINLFIYILRIVADAK